MKKLLILVVALAALWSLSAVSAEENSLGPAIGTESASYTVNLPARSTCPLGDDCIIYRNGGSKTGLISTDFDTYNLVVSGTRTVTVLVVDCCTQGDTLQLSMGSTSLKAISPKVIYGQKQLAAGNYALKVGYAAAPNGFPAEYAIAISGE